MFLWGKIMQVGTFSDIIFETSSEKILTFKDFKRDTKTRYAKHDLLNQTPALEYIGSDLGEISFEMQFHKDLGVNPAEEAEKVRKLCADGTADYLVIGNRVIGENLWVIESVAENLRAFDKNMDVYFEELTVTLKEYYHHDS